MHYHVELNWLSEEYQTDSFDSLVDALESITDELNRATEFEYEGISINGDMGDYESAYRAFELCNTLDAVIANLRSILDQYGGPRRRAPLYQGSNGETLLIERMNRYLTDEPFADLPLKYTPYVWECALDMCEQYQDDQDAREG